MTVHVRGLNLILLLVLFWVSYLRYLGGLSNVQAMSETGPCTLGHIVTYSNPDGLAWLPDVVINRYTFSAQAICISVQLRSRIRTGHLPPDLSSCLRCPIRLYCPLYRFFCLYFSFRFFVKCGGLSWYTNIRYFASSVFSRGLHSFFGLFFPGPLFLSTFGCSPLPRK